jgi:D-glycero-alpha-D-manno-heptose-7-phosphate kinase
MSASATPHRTIHSTAPIRICDNGGWTDTWFARHGKVFNIAVRPAVAVTIAIFERRSDVPRITIDAADFRDRYDLDDSTRGRHPLLEAAVEHVVLPPNTRAEVRVTSPIPAGASTGTSAAVSVALLGALELLAGRQPVPREIARMAHALETEALKRQSGVQDQYCAAFGGINFIEITEYPDARISQLAVRPAVRAELERRLVLIYLGNSHDSSQVHKRVIAGLEDAGPEHPPLQMLRRAADASREAVLNGDLAALGRAMRENTDAQAALHPALVGPTIRRIIDLAREHDALGWKVNGAGGEGGTLTILASDRGEDRSAMLDDIAREDATCRAIPIVLSPSGLTVTIM